MTNRPPCTAAGSDNWAVRDHRALLACLTIGAAALAACGSSAGSHSATGRIFEGPTITVGRSQVTFRPVIRQLPVSGSHRRLRPGR